MAIQGFLDYLIHRQGGSSNPNFEEIKHPSREHGPRLFIREVRTGLLWEYIHTDHISKKTLGELVEDPMLRTSVLGDEAPPVPEGRYWRNRFLVRY